MAASPPEELKFANGVKRENLRLGARISFCFVDLLRDSGAFTSDEAIRIGTLNGLFVLGRSIGFIGHHLGHKRLRALFHYPADIFMNRTDVSHAGGIFLGLPVAAGENDSFDIDNIIGAHAYCALWMGATVLGSTQDSKFPAAPTAPNCANVKFQF
ncbi:hypothetical protein C8R45DRAFT_1163913 [Mycena sanguinolenta]|nr:hypothetical protein C8R45DRAFT_1163913 [Mycena sanguinolenta]